MANHGPLIKQLLNDLSQDVKGYQQLALQLKQQHLLLTNRDSNALLSLNQDLDQVMATLSQHAKQRAESMTTLGLTQDDQGMQRLFAALPAPLNQQGRQLWQQLHKLTLECQSLNNQNGRLLAHQKQLMDKLLKPEQQYCYGPAV